MASPTEINIDELSLGKFDFKPAEAEFLADPEKFLVVDSVRQDGRVLSLSLKGELITAGINVGNYEGTPHSIGIALKSDDVLALQDLNTFLRNMEELDDEWDIKEIAPRDILYVKLKRNEKGYVFKHDVKLDPKKPNDSPLKRNQPIEVIVDVLAYFNFQADKKDGKKKAGISFAVTELKAKEEKPKKPKKN